MAIGLLWLRRRSLPDYTMMLTLVVFAATSTVVCFVDGKNWYYHRLPAIVATVLALLLWTATELVQRRWRIRWPLLVAGLAVTVFCASSIRQLEPEAMDAVEPQKTTVDRLEEMLRTEHARTYIAFSEWIALGFPVVNETGVTWASRFDSMWALKGEVWRARFDPGMADRALGGARLHRRLPGYRGGGYAGDDEIHQGTERGRSRVQARLVALPEDRVVRWAGGVPARPGRLLRCLGCGGVEAGGRHALGRRRRARPRRLAQAAISWVSASRVAAAMGIGGLGGPLVHRQGSCRQYPASSFLQFGACGIWHLAYLCANK